MNRPFSGAPKVQAVPVPTGRDDEAWMQARDAGVGASDIGIIMGVSTFSSPYSLWWQKHLHWRLPDNEAMADGRAHEDMVVAEFREHHPELVVAKASVPLWRHPAYEWALCTPDYLAVQDGAVVPVELKWDASPGWGPSGSDDVPYPYRLQVMWQAWIFGADGGWLVNHKPTGRNRYREYWIPVEMSVIDEAITAAAKFVASMETGVSPDPDGSKATERALQELHAGIDPGSVSLIPPDLAEQWVRAREDVRTAEAYKRLMDNRLREVLGSGERGINADTGAVFVERRISKRAGYEVGPALVDSLRKVSDVGSDTIGEPGPHIELPGADGAVGADAPASAAGSEEAGGASRAADAGHGGTAGGDGAGEPGAGDPGEPAGDCSSEGPTIVDVVTRCAPHLGLHATPHNGPCLLREAL